MSFLPRSIVHRYQISRSTHFQKLWKVSEFRFFSQSNPLYSQRLKVAVLGAASRAGGSLSLFLKQSCLIDELALYDSKSVRGLALELSHIDTRCKVSGWSPGEACLKKTLEDAKIVTILTEESADTLDKPLKANAEILSDLLPSVIRFCPLAMVAIAMNPMNSLIPLAVEMYKKAGIYEYNRLFGVTTLDSVRANSFVSEITGIEAERIVVPVIGGGSPRTCIPVFSQMKPHFDFSEEDVRKLTRKVWKFDEEFVKAKGQLPFLAKAFAVARFCISLCKAIRHEPDVIEYAYVRSCVLPGVTYFAAPLEIGSAGIQKHLGIPPLNPIEQGFLTRIIPSLKLAIKQGETLALGPKNKSSEACQQSSQPCDQAFLSSLPQT